MSDEEKNEREHFKSVVNALKNYKLDSETAINRKHETTQKLNVQHQEMLSKFGFTANLEKISKCVTVNQSILDGICADATEMFENAAYDFHDLTPQGDKQQRTMTKPMDIEKVQSTLKLIVRDWSEDGADERETCYKPILDELVELFPTRPLRTKKKVLLPGAGMGRLAYDVANLGFQSQGNEFSLFMLCGSNYVLNQCKSKNSMTVYPWVHQYCNNRSGDDVTRAVKFPDISPSLSEDTNFSMIAGDFLEVYSDQTYTNSLDVVVTCFFLDCAHNVIDFIELIHKILKPGGTWLNLGPLLYHFADTPKESSIEPTYEVVRKIVLEVGFDLKKEVSDHQATYCHNPKSMLQYNYNCVFFTAVKKNPQAVGSACREP